MRWLIAFLLVLLLAVLAALPLVSAPAHGEFHGELPGKIVGVHDGDTVTLLSGEQTYKIRLEGIDAPELGQPFGKRSKKALSGAIFAKPVRVETYGSDRYGRVIGRIYYDGMDVNTASVASGWAWHYTKYSDSKTHPMPPWEWRAAKRSRSAKSDQPDAKEGKAAQPPGAKFWLNSSSNVRHNASCKYFETTKRGRFCGPNVRHLRRIGDSGHHGWRIGTPLAEPLAPEPVAPHGCRREPTGIRAGLAHVISRHSKSEVTQLHSEPDAWLVERRDGKLAKKQRLGRLRSLLHPRWLAIKLWAETLSPAISEIADEWPTNCIPSFANLMT